MVLNRFDKNGSIDETFGIDGESIAIFGDAKSFCNSAIIQYAQNDEKIITAGHSWNGNNFDFALSRYNSNGSIDNTFGINGNITTSIGELRCFC